MTELKLEDGTIVDRKNGLVAACECGWLVPLSQSVATRTEGVGWRRRIVAMTTCFKGTCGCGQVFKTKTDSYKLNEFGRLVADGDNGPGAEEDGDGDTQEAVGGPGGS